MRKAIRAFSILTGIAALLCALLVWDVYGFFPFPSICGHLSARSDIARGHYVLLGYGLPFRGADEYTRILRQRYRVEFRYVAFCTVSRSQRDYADAYDKISRAAVNEKFGKDVFKESYEESQKWAFQTPELKTSVPPIKK